MEINERQRLLLEKVIEAHVSLGQPVGSKWLSEQAGVPWGPSTVRAELARLEMDLELGHIDEREYEEREDALLERLAAIRGEEG